MGIEATCVPADEVARYYTHDECEDHRPNVIVAPTAMSW